MPHPHRSPLPERMRRAAQRLQQRQVPDVDDQFAAELLIAGAQDLELWRRRAQTAEAAFGQLAAEASITADRILERTGQKP